jgi:IS5 family transposase
MLGAFNAKLIDHRLVIKSGTLVGATLSARPSSSKNDNGELDPDMHQINKGKQ